ncbi:unnamed protein product [Polarella glacialis]|uniref:Uncharacterized protein n=1 Tax=Polarella glacialis TaxID=89957 RepID=A0A813JKI1_POLGL|nr:unnamed protein product [Polarella glacialis]
MKFRFFISRAAPALLLLLFRLEFCRAVHYENPPCAHDEVQGEVLGASGYTCSPRCDDAAYNCPVDMPLGASAQPQCMLQDVDKGAFCGLVCQVDAQCPTGSQCTQLTQMGVGICLYPASFADWARTVITRKLSVGWPKKGGSVETFQIAKTLAALQSMKSKYSIDDGDVDMLTLKELLNSVSPSSVAPSGGSLDTAASAVASLAATRAATAPTNSGGGSGSGDFKIWETDLSRLGNEMGRGLPGVQSELSRDVYLAEHLSNQFAASDLLRTVVIFGVIYLAVGSFIKYQTNGASGINMIPHVGFWVEYPALVVDGIAYSKMLLDGAMGKSTSASSSYDTGLCLDGGIRGASLGRGGGAGAFEAL